MAESKTEIIKLSYGNSDDLRALLESIDSCGAMAPAIISKQHYESFLKAKNNNIRKIFAAEMFCKLMQSIEDYGAFCLMWTEDEGNPLEKYLNVVTPRIIKFYRECSTTECSDRIRKIWGIPTAEQLIRKNILNADEKLSYEVFISKFIEEIERTFKQLKGFFQEAEDSSRKGDYGDIVNMYFNAKHGFKIMFSTKTSSKIGVTDGSLSILIGPGILPTGDDILKYGKFRIDSKFVGGLFERTKMIGEKLKALAHVRLGQLNNEDSFVHGFRNWQNGLQGDSSIPDIVPSTFWRRFIRFMTGA